MTVPHSDSDLNSRKMVVLQEYRPTDSQGLGVRRGELVQVISEEPNWTYVRNERNKEGYVPAINLVAPYSSMRSNRRMLGIPPGGGGGGGVPIRHVASGSSIDIKDQPHPVVPMYPSTSAGRPRNFSMGDEHRIHVGGSHTGPPVMGYGGSSSAGPPGRRGYSPHELTNGGGGGGIPSLSQGNPPMTSPSDQKYSPSTSSGVASFTGTNSPVGGHSDGSNHSSFCSIEDDRVREVMGEEGMAHHHYGNATSYSSRSNKPHPHHHAHATNEQQQNAYNGETTPPPIPPRTFQPQNAPSHSPHPPPPPAPGGGSQDSAHHHHHQHQDDFDQDADSSYASPADALLGQHPQQSPHLGQPRVRSLNDVRLREIRRTQENGVYSQVFQGHQRPAPRQNGYRAVPTATMMIGDEDSNMSEGGSSRSRGSSSRKSGSRVSSLRTQTTTERYPSSSYEYEVFSHESDVTLNESADPNRSGRPLSGNSLNSNSPTKIKKFRKNLWGLYIVTQDFEACDENEVSVRAEDHVSVWNQDDRDWYWIVKHDTSEEGFVPSSCLKEIVNSESQQASQQELGESREIVLERERERELLVLVESLIES